MGSIRRRFQMGKIPWRPKSARFGRGDGRCCRLIGDAIVVRFRSEMKMALGEETRHCRSSSVAAITGSVRSGSLPIAGGDGNGFVGHGWAAAD
ncbi:hypothetical protein ACLOJK_034854 [Asimina triloba]